MTDTRDALADLVAAAQNARDIQADFDRLRRIEAWALSTLHVHDDDAVVITEPINTNNDWRIFSEVLVPGCTGIVTALYLSTHSQRWCGYFTPDVQWTVNDRFGRRKETRPAMFMLPLRVLRLRTADDEPLTMPADAKDWNDR